MIRTRDLILFIVVLFFLGTSIISTVTSKDEVPVSDTKVLFNSTEYQGGAISSEVALDRKSILERLRVKLANSTEQIEPVASVEAPEVDKVFSSDGVTLQRCLYPDDALSIVPKWPLADVQMSFQGNVRMAYIEQLVPDVPAIASSSVPTASEPIIKSLLKMPLIPQKLPEVTCVPSEVVGVTDKGILIFNGDVATYRKIHQDSLVGFARDGFPIYGVYNGTVDACGGYDHPAGYRYTVSSERDYIIGCYVATPAKFSL